jgi:hypothetical protein
MPPAAADWAQYAELIIGRAFVTRWPLRPAAVEILSIASNSWPSRRSESQRIAVYGGPFHFGTRRKTDVILHGGRLIRSKIGSKSRC